MAPMTDTRDGRDIVERLRALSNSIGDEAADIIEVHRNSIDALVAGWNNDRAELIRLRSERVAVPEGWTLVPVEPTDVMIHAGRCETAKINNDDDYEQAQACYRAMLAASPQPPTYTLSSERARVIEECAMVADQFAAVTEQLEGENSTTAAGIHNVAAAIRARAHGDSNDR